MALLTSLRLRAPWVAGVVLLAFLGLPLLGFGMRFGLREYWAFYVGAAALLILLAGWLERVWQSRPLERSRSRSASAKKSRFRILPGGRASGPSPRPDDDDPDKPRWVM